MKLATILSAGRRHLGVVDAERRLVRLVDGPSDMLELIRDFRRFEPALRGGPELRFEDVVFDAPIPRPARNIFCVGKNYRAHALEFSKSGFDKSAPAGSDAIPTSPIIFTKAPSSVIGPGAAIVRPRGQGEQVDYEAELAVVIGTGGKEIPRAKALDHVFGYTIVNDVTARDLQAKHKQWFLGKSPDTFCPMGPWIATADEIDPAGTRVQCWVNDEPRQDASTRDLIFDIPTLIETISALVSLEPGDILATGTPEGVGIGFSPPKFLRPGDRIRICIDKLGELINPVTDATASP